MLDELSGLGAPLAFVLIFAFVAGDSIVPAVPGEAATLAGAVLAAQGELAVAVVVAATWLGAVAGDNVMFALGATGGRRVLGRRASTPRVEHARVLLRERGPTIILVARFLPGGRNAVSLAAGTLGMRWRVFAPWDVLAAALWAICGTTLGYVSGKTFESSFIVPLAASLVVATAVGASFELVRRTRRRVR